MAMQGLLAKNFILALQQYNLEMKPDKFGWITIVEPTETTTMSKYKMELKEIMHSVAANVKKLRKQKGKK